MRNALYLIAASALLTGCAAQKHIEIQRVNVPVPIACQEQLPERPDMPTEGLGGAATLDQFAQAAIAEIERRQGYEVVMRAALLACTAPVGAVTK